MRKPQISPGMQQMIKCWPKIQPANWLDMPGPDLELGARTTSLLSNRSYPISTYSSLPSRAPSVSSYSSLPSIAGSISAYSSLPIRPQISLHDGTYNNLRLIKSTHQHATNQLQSLAMFGPATPFATVEHFPEPEINICQVEHSANFISYNRNWGWYQRQDGHWNDDWIV